MHDEHEMTHIGLAMSIRPSVRMIQHQNRWMNFDEIWFRHVTISYT
jgi:hypothetical protein